MSKQLVYGSIIVLLIAISASGFAIAISDWKVMYNYTDNESSGGIKENEQNGFEVFRAYAVKNPIKRFYMAKFKIVEKTDFEKSADWAGPRLSLANPDNLLERYEVRFLPIVNKLQVNYVDRTGRTGDVEIDDKDTLSRVIASTDCKIDTDRNYLAIITKNKDKYRVTVFSSKNPTCFLKWKDDTINTDKLNLAIQSAGKYVISNFDKITSG